jgi:hypothetical protein
MVLEYVALIISCLTAMLCLTQMNRIQQRVDKKNKAMDDDRRMETILALYDNIEGLMDNFEHYVEEVRQEFERERGHMTELSRQAAVLYSKSAVPVNTGVSLTEPQSDPIPEQSEQTTENGATRTIQHKPLRSSRLTESENRKLSEMSAKQQKVRYLMSRGFSLEEIARELDIGKGEVRLIADLDKS